MATDDRDEKGRFRKGYQGGPGRPRRATEEKYLQALATRVKLADWKSVVDKAIEDAKAGDFRARQFLADYLIGKATQYVSADVAGLDEPTRQLLAQIGMLAASCITDPEQRDRFDQFLKQLRGDEP